MLTLPVTIFLAAAVGLGLYLFLLHLRGVRRTGLVTLHFLLGAAGLLQLLMVQRGTPAGDMLPGNRFGSFAAGLFAFSMMSGVLAPLLARNRRGEAGRSNASTMLNIHVAIGVAGFLSFLAWLSNV